MKSEIDLLMAASDIDAILVTGPGQHNPAMVYLTGGAHLTGADLIKKRGEPAILFHGPMERDEAAKSGLRTCSYSNYPYGELLAAAGGNRLRADALRYQRMLADAGMTAGRVALYGRVDAGSSFALFSELQALVPEITLVGSQEIDLLAQAMMTKEAGEVERIRAMGKITTAVVGRVAEFLTHQTARNGVLIGADDYPLTLAAVKQRINLWLSELGAENPGGTIFSIGRDAGVPHSAGNPADLLKLGQTIVFDIFPCEPGGGYYYDFTRSWCLGFAPDEALALYENVLSVYRQIISELKVDEPFKNYQRRTCELFEAQGHPTIASHPGVESGYVHSVGHGLGLKVHERPASGTASLAGDLLVPGVVFTIEPGLYYPERGLGIRLEDSVYVTPQGKFEILADFPLDLVLPVKGG
jgi:Xaa-Pro aminopeptidase